MTVDRDGLQDPALVESVQSTLLAALKTHCAGRYGSNGAVMVGRLLAKLAELRSMGQLARDLLTWRLQTTSEASELAVLTRLVSALDDRPASYVNS